MRSVLQFSLALGLIGGAFGYSPLAYAQAVSNNPSTDTAAALDYLEGLEAYEKDDYKTAAQKLEQAADQGFAQAQYILASMYVEGQGVPKDFVLAHKWVNLATIGNASHRKLRDALESLMTPAQIAEAQKLASEWKKKQAP